jgi:hypothetical protein
MGYFHFFNEDQHYVNLAKKKTNVSLMDMETYKSYL